MVNDVILLSCHQLIDIVFFAGIGTLPGLHCTDNDLAFLQRMQTVKEYEELKVCVVY